MAKQSSVLMTCFSFLFLGYSFLVSEALALPTHLSPKYQGQLSLMGVTQLPIVSFCILYKIIWPGQNQEVFDFLPKSFERDKSAKWDPLPSPKLYGNEMCIFLILFYQYKRELQWTSYLSHFSLTAFLIFLSDKTYLGHWFSNLSEFLKT